MANEYFENFQRGYWNYYLELEKRMENTKEYVEFDSYNSKIYSSTYLILMQAVCSEIDVVGKEIASHFSADFRKDKGNKPINRWWYEIQDTMPGAFGKVQFSNAIERTPWKDYRVVKVVSKRLDKNGNLKNVTNYNLQPKDNGSTYATPKWWNTYNKVKHKRLDLDKDFVNYKNANLENLTNAFAALYLLEFEFMKKIGTLEERVSCGQSTLFGMGDLANKYIHSFFAAEDDPETLVAK